ncbi:hypothetical protein AA106555_0779 [Neokomagataea thailandica NBRC 106555]|uniref:Uncharacterized protein n=2 Tax=Neokomagataea TaxID=1223423 RepID=A0A4Y6V8D4_9PROT|nr:MULTISPECIES: hypothetical protein [Neokomagataea]QDH25138.1 hypothetical protein D5366_07850 [Neokomagataea tanensis]GBR52045.1 hypothetical protein AA106555_0779 [Neokomagataea thailandica NBRC 106555]
MDVQTIERAYSQLQQQSQQSAQALQTLGSKLQSAAQGGDQQAREWSLDLRELALAFQAEQQQVASLLQQLHAALSNASQNQNFIPQDYAQQPAPVAPVQQPPQASSGGFFSNFLNSGFARSVEAGAGFAIGDDLIKDIF